MLFELFKNSMRAVMEYSGSDSDNCPPLEVLLVRGKEDICVKVRQILRRVIRFSKTIRIHTIILYICYRYLIEVVEFLVHKWIIYLSTCIALHHSQANQMLTRYRLQDTDMVCHCPGYMPGICTVISCCLAVRATVQMLLFI